jgi:hypothetical protein
VRHNLYFFKRAAKRKGSRESGLTETILAIFHR